MLFLLRQQIARCCHSPRGVAAVATTCSSLPQTQLAVRHLSATAVVQKHNPSKEVAKMLFELPESTPAHINRSRSSRTIKVHHVDGGDVISSHLNQRVQLFRLPRTVLDPYFYIDKPALYFTHKMFFLSFRPLQPDVVRNINLGPNYLRGTYPQGVLHWRHEWRRPINFEENCEARGKAAFRDVSEDPAEDEERIKEHIRPVESMEKMRPLLVHGRDLDKTAQQGLLAQDDNVPFLVITTKKRVDKRASYRNSTRTRLIDAVAFRIGRHIEDLPRMDKKGNPLAMVWQVREGLKDYTRQELLDAVDEALTAVAKMHQAKAYEHGAWQSNTDEMPPQRDQGIYSDNARLERDRLTARVADNAAKREERISKSRRRPVSVFDQERFT